LFGFGRSRKSRKPDEQAQPAPGREAEGRRRERGAAGQVRRDDARPQETAPTPAAATEPPPQDQPRHGGRRGLVRRLAERLRRTREGLGGALAGLLRGRRRIDEELLEELETRLLMADVGVEATRRIVDGLARRVARRELDDPEALLRALREALLETVAPCSRPLAIDPARRPFVILVVGVNGVGKTTTIGKLAHRFRDQGLAVMLAAGDTFRAAAVEQLQAWGERTGVPVVAQHTGADSASVIYDALQAARARGVDVLLADTAGRLHTKSNLMEELAKVVRVVRKLDPEAPHEVLLVLDATTGQNALAQARQFHEAVRLTGIAVTKLDGTAKGGILFAIAEALGIPIRYIGVGEGPEDLREFDASAFVEALFEESPEPAAP